MLILDTESTCKWHCYKKLKSHSGCKNEQQADFEIQLENKITITYSSNCHNCKKLQPNVQNARGKFSEFYVNFGLGEHL